MGFLSTVNYLLGGEVEPESKYVGDMDDPQEQQIQELELLQSMYPIEFECKSFFYFSN